MAAFELTRVLSREDAEPIVAALDGRSYMTFRVLVCPAAGEFSVWVETDYTDDEAEAKNVALFIMAEAIIKAGRQTVAA